MAAIIPWLAGTVFSLLGAFVLLSLAWRLASGLRSRLSLALEERAKREEPRADALAAPLLGRGAERNVRLYVYRCLEGQNQTGRVFRAVLLALIAASVGCFVLGTRLEVSDSARRLMDVVETATVLFFTLEFGIRVWVCVEGLPGDMRCCPRLRWLASDVYALMDLASLLPFYLDQLTTDALPVNLRLLRALRAMQLLEDVGAGVETFGKIFAEKAEVLLASSFFGASVWLVCSTLFYHFERGNPAMVLCPLCRDPGDPKSCRGAEQSVSCYGRMDSIPSAMYFCLVNLFGEFPLMLEHTVGGKCVGVFIAIVGKAMAGIACGIIGNGFADYVQKDKGAQEPGDDAEGAPGHYAALPDSPGGSHAGGPAWLRALDRPRGAWAKVCCGLAVVGWLQALLVGHMQATEDSAFAAAFQSEHGGELDLGAWGDFARASSGPFEAASAALLGAEYAVRLAAARRAWGPCATFASSRLGLADLLAFAPALLAPAAPGAWAAIWIWPLVCVARTLKLERYMSAFRALGRVVAQSAPILITTGVVAIVLLLMFSTLMWLAEFANPIEEVRGNYESIPKAMWMTLLNLSGECPLADYTVPGKILTGFIGVFAVSIFSIPFGLMSDGFQEYLDDEGQDDSQAPDEQREIANDELQQQRMQQLATAAQRRHPGPAAMLKLLQGSQDPDCGVWSANLEKACISMTLFSVALTLLESCSGFGTEAEAAGSLWLQAAELVSVLWFTLEFLVRLYAAPAEPRYLSRSRYILSFCGVIDILSIAPYYLSLFSGSSSILGELGAVADRRDEEFRLCRLLRLLLLTHYVPSLGLIVRVLKDPGIRQDLRVALYVAATCWLFFATLLHIAEGGDSQNPDMAWRFRSVLSGMSFTLIHLTGDYPLVDYTLPARLVHVLMLVAAQGLVGVAGGVIASGFTRELQDFRERERERQRKATEVLGRAVRSWLFRRRWAKMHRALKEEAEREKRAAEQADRRSHRMWQVQHFVHGRACTGARTALILLNVICVLAESVPGIRAAAGSAAFKALDLGFVVAFSMDYAAKLWSAPVVSGFGFRRRSYAFSFFGIVDLLTVAPYWLQSLLSLGGMNTDIFVFRVVPSLRILQLEEVVQAFTLLDDAWNNCKDTVQTSALLAFMVWLFGAVLFFELERENEALDGALDSIPSALHFTAIFLGGEWAIVDFTPLGKLLCVLYCMLGIAVFAIPVGSFFEAFEAAITGDGED